VLLDNSSLLQKNGYAVLASKDDLADYRKWKFDLVCKQPLPHEVHIEKLEKPFLRLPERSLEEAAECTLARIPGEHGGGNLVVSNEGFFDCNLGRLRNSLLYLSAMLAPLASTHDVQLVVYFREQARFVLSYKKNFPQNILPWEEYREAFAPFSHRPEDEQLTLDWNRQVEVIREVFPDADLTIRSYDRVQKEGGICNDFLECIGLSSIAPAVHESSVNPGLNPLGLRVLERCSSLSYSEIGRMKKVLGKQYGLNSGTSDRCLFWRREIEQMQTHFHDANCRLHGFGDEQYDRYLRFPVGSIKDPPVSASEADAFLVERVLQEYRKGSSWRDAVKRRLGLGA